MWTMEMQKNWQKKNGDAEKIQNKAQRFQQA